MDLYWFFDGGKFNFNYNIKYEFVVIDILVDVKCVEVVVWIIGYGFGLDVVNCVEFCNYIYYFIVNGIEYSYDQLWVGKQYGCVS